MIEQRARKTGEVRFAGYAAVFDRLDNGGDVIRRGAFRQSLAGRQQVPLLWQHRAGRVLGTVERLEEDKRGLRIIGRLDGSAAALQVARQLQSGNLTGLSFGYRIKDASSDGVHREIRDLDLLEVSIVTRPMQPLARIHKVT